MLSSADRPSKKLQTITNWYNKYNTEKKRGIIRDKRVPPLRLCQKKRKKRKENNIKSQEDIFRTDKPLYLPTYEPDYFNCTEYQSPYSGVSKFVQDIDEVGGLNSPTLANSLKSPKSVRYSLLSQFGKGKDGIGTTNEKQTNFDNANNNRRKFKRVLQIINLSDFNQVDKTKASFNAYIATSLVSFVFLKSVSVIHYNYCIDD